MLGQFEGISNKTQIRGLELRGAGHRIKLHKGCIVQDSGLVGYIVPNENDSLDVE